MADVTRTCGQCVHFKYRVNPDTGRSRRSGKTECDVVVVWPVLPICYEVIWPACALHWPEKYDVYENYNATDCTFFVAKSVKPKQLELLKDKDGGEKR